MKVIEITTGDGETFVCEAKMDVLERFTVNYRNANYERVARDYLKQLGTWLTYTEKEMTEEEFFAIPATPESAAYFVTNSVPAGV